jgi:DNA-binding NarL/FixJ family response regulator
MGRSAAALAVPLSFHMRPGPRLPTSARYTMAWTLARFASISGVRCTVKGPGEPHVGAMKGAMKGDRVGEPNRADEPRPSYLVVEDSAAYSRSLTRVIGRWGNTHVVRSARAAQTAIVAKAWAAIFLDVGLPDGSGLDVLAKLRAVRPTTPVLVLTGSHEPEVINRACELQASFAVKPVSTSLIETFIRAAASLRDRLGTVADAWRERYGLTEAERDVLYRSALGESRLEIAAARSSSILTVKKHCEKIGKKTDARFYHEAVGRLVREVAE